MTRRRWMPKFKLGQAVRVEQADGTYKPLEKKKIH